MATLVHTCQNLSNYHIVSHWGRWTFTDIATELCSLGLKSCPPTMRRDVMIGLKVFTYTHIYILIDKYTF